MNTVDSTTWLLQIIEKANSVLKTTKPTGRFHEKEGLYNDWHFSGYPKTMSVNENPLRSPEEPLRQEDANFQIRSYCTPEQWKEASRTIDILVHWEPVAKSWFVISEFHGAEKSRKAGKSIHVTFDNKLQVIEVTRSQELKTLHKDWSGGGSTTGTPVTSVSLDDEDIKFLEKTIPLFLLNDSGTPTP